MTNNNKEVMAVFDDCCSSQILVWMGGIALLCIVLLILLRKFRQIVCRFVGLVCEVMKRVRFKLSKKDSDLNANKSVSSIFDEALRYVHAGSRRGSAPYSQNENEQFNLNKGSATVLPLEIDSVPVKLKRMGEGEEDLENIVSGIESLNLKELIKDRVADLSREWVYVEEWAVRVVDFIDEMTWMKTSISSQDALKLQEVVQQCEKLLILSDCTIVDDATWSPQRQRAVSINKVLKENSEPRISKKGASGVIVQGCLIRKQEVYLDVSVNS